MTKSEIKKHRNRINYLRKKLREEKISYGELIELEEYEKFLVKVAGFSEEDARIYLGLLEKL